MLPFKRILCPTDFSEPSLEAVRAASELAGHFSAKLYLVHVVHPTPSMSLGQLGEGLEAFDVLGYEKALAAAAKKRLRSLIGEAVSSELQAETVVVAGDPARRILELADEKKADLILIATHGRTGWAHLVAGSVAEKVVRYASCPVLTVRWVSQGLL